ncbi:hypothetical protein AB0M41_34845 [Streptomyces sp. NPDC051896]|uniref:hypothetical protein n=1 Tax=Streptomyces sp. NPDC051896 TaxID=3155416 RepID=UPI003413FD1A
MSGSRPTAAQVTAGDDITFTFDAHLAAKDTRNPRKATGTFAFSHYPRSGA